MPTFPENPDVVAITDRPFHNPQPRPQNPPPIRWDNVRPFPGSARLTDRLMLVTVEVHPPGRTRTFAHEPFQRIFPSKDT